MILLTYLRDHTESVVAAGAPYFQVAGGTIWQSPEQRLVACYFDGGWRYGPWQFTGVRFRGGCRLLSGIVRDPTQLSEPVESVTLLGRVLLADNTEFAEFDPGTETWRRIDGGLWWQAFRIVSSDIVAAYLSPPPLPTTYHTAEDDPGKPAPWAAADLRNL